MKRIVLLLAAAAVILGACKKKDDPQLAAQKPSFTWEENSSFAQLEIAEDMHSIINVSAPEGIVSFTLSFTTVPVTMVGKINQEITISGNKGTKSAPCVYDFVSDASLASTLSAEGILSPAGSKLSGATQARLDVGALIYRLCKTESDVMENGEKFEIELKLNDSAENELKKSARFQWTTAPAIAFKPERGTKVIYLDAAGDFDKEQIVIEANGKIAGIVLRFGGENADPSLLSYVKGLTKTDAAAIDIVANDKVAKACGLITGTAADVVGKVNLTLPLDMLLLQLSLQSTDSHSTYLTVEVVDQLGKVSEETIILSSANLGK